MAATNFTVVRRNKKNGQLIASDFVKKWTYKTALAIAVEATPKNDEEWEIICVVETNRMFPNDKKDEKKE